MAKRLLYIIICLFISQSVLAQNAVGSWRKHGVFGNSFTRVIETERNVFFLADGWLYEYDKENQESNSISESGDLNDVSIKDIYYNPEKKYLFVAYVNGNIDIIKEDGTTINMPDIYVSSVSSTKNINDVTFSVSGAFVATDFGYVHIDDNKFEVRESRIYNKAIKSLCEVGDYLVISTSDRIYLEEKGKHYGSLEELTMTSFNQGGRVRPVDDTTFLFENSWLYLFSVKTADVSVKRLLSSTSVKNLERNEKGYMFSDVKGLLSYLDSAATLLSTMQLPESMRNSRLSSYNSDGTLWELNENGIRNISFDDAGAETILMDYFRPNASSVDVPYYLVFNTEQEKLYVMNSGSTRFISGYLRLGALSSYDGSTWTELMPDYAPTLNSSNDNKKINAPYSLVFDPEDSNTYYIGSWFEGVYKVTDGKVVAKYDWTNSPLKKVEVSSTFHTCTTPCLMFDNNKNLWVLQGGNDATPLAVLPRAKQSLSSTDSSDWLTPSVKGVSGEFRSHMFFTSKGVKLQTKGIYDAPLVMFYDDENPASSNIQSKVFTTLTDQDGKEYAWDYINCFAEDKNGKVWMGTDNGVVEYYPQNAFAGSTFTINHIKVPRNDGTNLADYLLDNTEVTCIAVDGSNRKWLGTATSGILLVSEDGSEILEQFTTDNSPLLSNRIISVCCNPLNNKVYVGTEKGLMEYSSDSEPPAESYSEIYAYPNPVRPEYTGEITIRGLMENSLVKIADSEGNVIKSIRSIGGMTTWDGCDNSGKPVKSGVYFILASQNENETSSGAVSKILIIR